MKSLVTLHNPENGRIIILSTHIVSDIEEIASDIIFMKNGEFINHINLHFAATAGDTNSNEK